MITSAAPSQRADGAEQVDGGVAELAGDHARDGTRDAIGDVEEGDEGPHRAAAIGGQHPLEGFHAKRGENQRAAKARDQRAGERDDLIGRAPDHRLTDRLDHQRPERHPIAAHPVRQRAEHDTDEDEADAERGHDQTGMAPVPRGEVKRGEGR